MTVVVTTTEPTSLVAVADQCSKLEIWAEQCESIPELQDANNKLAAIDDYLAKTSIEGRSRVAAAMRRLEVRIGKLLPPPMTATERGALAHADPSATARMPQLKISGRDRRRFRQMAENEDIVEQVIASSHDRDPASRNSVIRKITGKSLPAHNGKTDKSRAGVAERENEVREMARKGNTSLQIANKLGIGREGVQVIAKRIGIEIPADASRVKSKFDHDRIVATLVHDLEGARFTLDLLDYTELDHDRIQGWVDSLTESIQALNKLKTNLVKESTRE